MDIELKLASKGIAGCDFHFFNPFFNFSSIHEARLVKQQSSEF